MLPKTLFINILNRIAWMVLICAIVVVFHFLTDLLFDPEVGNISEYAWWFAFYFSVMALLTIRSIFLKYAEKKDWYSWSTLFALFKRKK